MANPAAKGAKRVAKGAKPVASSVQYSVHPGVAMMQDWVAKLPEKTGRSLDEWVRLVKASGPPTEKERREWLKKEHGLGTNSAGWIAERAEGKEQETADPETYLKAAAAWVEGMFSGPRVGLRPVYEKILTLARALGPDVRVSPARTIVPLYRRHVFAQIKPATLTRMDLGFALGDTKASGRLVDTGGRAKGDRITHRIPLTSATDVDEEVRRWLKKAYDMDA